MKPELLLPVRNAETFFAASEGGADAVYLGLKKFNARGKAGNFTPRQLQALLKESEKKKIKVYLTLNTLIKNAELPELLDILYILSQTKISAVIIQDWGVYYLLKKFFPKIPFHASTQMANHNSVGALYSLEKRFERVILARELTWNELKSIKKRAKIEIELFVHGALCYSFSGMCLFSSFNGGMSANRGLCTQPCRRLYNVPEESSKYYFSLKDLQLIDKIPEIIDSGISSLKIEGRMKSAEYVHNVAKAYRLAIDDPGRIKDAQEYLNYDFGREKTSYFMGRSVSESITENPYNGIMIGNVIKVFNDGFSFRTEHALSLKNRLRILSTDGKNATAIKIKKMFVNNIEQDDVAENTLVKIETDKISPSKGNKIFLLGISQNKFPGKFASEGKHLSLIMPENKKKNILGKIGSKKIPKYQQIIVRINDLKWMNKLRFDDLDKLILDLSRSEWENFNYRKPFIKKHIPKMILQLPKFIPEDMISYYKGFTLDFYRNGFKQFIVSHPSQKMIIPPQRDIAIYCSENVYSLNDSSIQFLKEEHFTSWIYPYENDFQNLVDGKDRRGIIPMFYLPELFRSRMPVKINSDSNFSDSFGNYHKLVREGQTIVLPDDPVAILQHYNKLVKNGFRRFLIDFSYINPSQKTFKRVLNNLLTSTKEKRSVIFNFKDGLK